MLQHKEEEKMKKIEKKRKLMGFTLGEMVITVAIVGTITAVAVPNYMRVRMQVNMEMVKQHLKTIGTHMNDLYNRNRQFPQDINQLGNTGEEVAITASLFGIDRREYTTDGYTTGPNLTTFQLRTCPKAGRWGIAGDRCFVLTPLGITEEAIGAGSAALNPWDAPVTFAGAYATSSLLTNPLFSPLLTRDQRISFLTAWMERKALFDDARFRMNNPPLEYGNCVLTSCNGAVFASYLFMTKDQLATLNDILPQVYDNLAKKGIYLSKADKDTSAIPGQCIYNCNYHDKLFSTAPTVVELGFKIDQPVKSWTDYANRVSTDQATVTSYWKQVSSTSESSINQQYPFNAALNPDPAVTKNYHGWG